MQKNIKHILVTGTHRSGTTWVGRTISQHPCIRYVHEPFNVYYPNPVIALKMRKWFEHYPSSSQQNQIKKAFDRLFLKRLIFQSVREILKKHRKTLFPRIIGLLNQRILIKDPIALLSAGWLHETYGLKVICMIRSPLAFVGSIKKAGYDFDFQNLLKQKRLMEERLRPYAKEMESMCNNDADFLDRACLLWNVLHFTISDYQKRYPSWMFVKHEELAADPISGYQEIFEYLGLQMNRTLQNYIKKFTSNHNPKECKTPSYQPRNSIESLKTWKERLTDAEIERVKVATRRIATKFYYL